MYFEASCVELLTEPFARTINDGIAFGRESSGSRFRCFKTIMTEAGNFLITPDFY